MNQQRFEHLLSAYGADFERWPGAERAEGAAFAASVAASQAMADARALDALLDTGRISPAPSDLLMARVLAGARKHQTPPAFNMRAALALAACAVFGVLLGYSGGQFAPASAEQEAYFASAFEGGAAAFGDEG